MKTRFDISGGFQTVLVGLVFACAIPAFSQTEDYSVWPQSRPLTINTSSSGANVTGTLTGFPLLVRLSTANAAGLFLQAKSGGADLRFSRVTSIPNSPQLPYEIERWDSAAGLAEIWVLMDSVYGNNSTQTIVMHWGKADAPARSNAAAVFDTANGFVGVWHMGGSSPTASRSNAVPGGNPAIPSGSSVATGYPVHSGAIGLADTLRGGSGTNLTSRTNNDHFNLGSGYADFTGGITVSMWLNPVSPPYTAWNLFLSMGNGAAQNNITVGRRGNTTNLFAEIYNGTTASGMIEIQNTLAYGQWNHATFAMSGKEKFLYYNGGQTAVSWLTDVAIPVVHRSEAYLGRSLWGDPNYQGSFDELRIHKVARSADWIKLEYHTQRPGSTVLTVVAPPNAPVLGTPAANASNVPLFTSLIWSGIGGATSYRVQLATDTLFTSLVLNEQTTATTRALGPLSANTSYFWRVQSIGYAGASGWSAVRRFTTETSSGTVPGAPTLSSPAAFALNVSRTPSLSWVAASGGATSYHAQLSTVPSFASFVVNDSAIAALQRAITTLAGSTEHYWRVRGKNGFGVGPWSEVRAFTTVATVPAAPTLTTPAAFATNVTAASPILSWTASPGATSYRVQVSLASAFTSFVVNDSTVTGTSRTLGTLAGFTDYYWRVNAKNSAGTSEFSLARRFTTGEPVAIETQGIFVMPVQLHAGMHLRFGLPVREVVSVQLFDARGKLTAVVWEGPLPAGVHTVLLPRTSAGIRIVKFRAGSYRKTFLSGPSSGF